MDKRRSPEERTGHKVAGEDAPEALEASRLPLDFEPALRMARRQDARLARLQELVEGLRGPRSGGR